MDPRADFKRMVLGLPHSAKDYASVAFTAELADLLGLDLVGIFAEDEGLIDLALLPCVREFRLSGDGWHRLEVEQLARSSSHAVAEARRLFDDAARSRRVATRFDLIKGKIGEAVGSQSLPDDIIVVIEPQNPAERVTYQFKKFMEMALNAQTAALLVPSRIIRRKGPVVVIAASEHDPSIRVGLTIAEAIREKLLVLAPAIADRSLSTRLLTTSAVHINQQSLHGNEIGLAELRSVLAIAGERLVVMSRGSDPLLPAQLASEQGVPVLVAGQSKPLSRSVDSTSNRSGALGRS
jgi:hypothetical protein